VTIRETQKGGDGDGVPECPGTRWCRKKKRARGIPRCPSRETLAGVSIRWEGKELMGKTLELSNFLGGKSGAAKHHQMEKTRGKGRGTSSQGPHPSGVLGTGTQWHLSSKKKKTEGGEREMTTFPGTTNTSSGMGGYSSKTRKRAWARVNDVSRRSCCGLPKGP